MKKILFILCLFVSSLGMSQDTTGFFGGISVLTSKIKGNSEIGSNILIGNKFNRYSLSGSFSNYNSLNSIELVNQYNLIEKRSIVIAPSVGLGYAETSDLTNQNSLFFSRVHTNISKSFILTPSLNVCLSQFLNLSVGYRISSDLNANSLVYSIGFRYNFKK